MSRCESVNKKTPQRGRQKGKWRRRRRRQRRTVTAGASVAQRPTATASGNHGNIVRRHHLTSTWHIRTLVINAACDARRQLAFTTDEMGLWRWRGRCASVSGCCGFNGGGSPEQVGNVYASAFPERKCC
ncbi:hypothetical protein Zmor_007150 [Zophobas morio]|uniref:Uncharacterized protein n=1 Tax=Zophobas morio TaxID=2755281 RepID=A0AA38MLY0_9CUCU|nr:hypothetical protein Zmor_007150 [Zophobas morio]